MPARRRAGTPRRPRSTSTGAHAEWAAFKGADRGQGKDKVSCLSCHTSLSYALGRPVLRQVAGDDQPDGAGGAAARAGPQPRRALGRARHAALPPLLRPRREEEGRVLGHRGRPERPGPRLGRPPSRALRPERFDEAGPPAPLGHAAQGRSRTPGRGTGSISGSGPGKPASRASTGRRWPPSPSGRPPVISRAMTPTRRVRASTDSTGSSARSSRSRTCTIACSPSGPRRPSTACSRPVVATRSSSKSWRSSRRTAAGASPRWWTASATTGRRRRRGPMVTPPGWRCTSSSSPASSAISPPSRGTGLAARQSAEGRPLDRVLPQQAARSQDACRQVHVGFGHDVRDPRARTSLRSSVRARHRRGRGSASPSR